VSQVRGKPFEQGNKFGKGRKAGSRNKSTIALQEIMDQYAEPILKKAALKALQGDTAALRLCLERILPPRRHTPVKFKLPSISSAVDVAQALETVLQAIASGKLTPTEGEAVAAAVERRGQSIERVDLDARLRALEKEREGADPK
jgi:hypothetical protein